MRAVVFRKFGALDSAAVEQMPDPLPAAGELLIEVKVAPVNYVDTVVIAGNYQFKPALPFVPGKGPAGSVAGIGVGVQGWSVGDRVLAMAESGGYAEKVCASASQCYRLPEDMSFEHASTISLAYDTAWFGLRERGRIAPGETVLVLGATGAVGNAAIQLGKAMGARVLATISSPAKTSAVLSAGADGIVDLSVANLRDGLREQVLSQTGGNGADIVLDMLGGDIFDAAMRAVAWRGRLVVIGFTAGRIPEVKANYLLVKNIEVSGLQISDYRKRKPEMLRACFDEVFRFFEHGLIRPGDVRAFPLDRYAEALQALAGRRAPGRLVLTP
jgi:NADPH:quinone reductase